MDLKVVTVNHSKISLKPTAECTSAHRVTATHITHCTTPLTITHCTTPLTTTHCTTPLTITHCTTSFTCFCVSDGSHSVESNTCAWSTLSRLVICEASFLSATSDDTWSLSTILLSAYRVHERVRNPSTALISAEPTRALSNAFHCSLTSFGGTTVTHTSWQAWSHSASNNTAASRMQTLKPATEWMTTFISKLSKTMRCLKSHTRSVAYLCSMLLVSLPGLACISLATQCLLVLSSCPMYGHTVCTDSKPTTGHACAFQLL